MTTNEAIAHFIIKNKKKLLDEYLYYYLKNFRYDSLGSTSSIAKAINSKIVREIPIVLPDLEMQKKIVKVLKKLDYKILINNKINKNLTYKIFLTIEKLFSNFNIKNINFTRH
jgi:type I restriction enzyme S subunit